MTWIPAPVTISAFETFDRLNILRRHLPSYSNRILKRPFCPRKLFTLRIPRKRDRENCV